MTWRYYRFSGVYAGGGGFEIKEVQLNVSGVNKAPLATATASSNFSGFTPAGLNDGSTSVGWASDFSGNWPQWFQFDFGAGNGFDVDEIKIWPSAANRAPLSFSVIVSNDGTNWFRQLTVENYTTWVGGAYNTFSITPFAEPAPILGWRYYRLTISAITADTGVEVRTINYNVSGVNMAIGNDTSGDQFSTALGRYRAFDGEQSTQWASGFTGPPQVITCDFGNERIIADQIQIKPHSGSTRCPKSFVVEVSNDAMAWTNVLTVTNFTSWTTGVFSNWTLSTPSSGTPPAITSLSPVSGDIAGGTAVTITGVSLTGTTDVKFDGTSATSIVVVNDTTITCVTPAHSAGAVDVEIFNPAGDDTATGAYTYSSIPPPDVDSVSPDHGPVSGGTSVTISGNYFTGATGATFDGGAATSFVVVNDTTITCVTPSHATIGLVDVVVSHALGDGTLTDGFEYINVARITQAAALIVYLPNQPARITQVPVLFAHLPIQATRVTQIVALPLTTPKPIPLPLPVVPETPVKEIWQWKTVVNIFENSKEQRSGLRSKPRISQQFSAFILDDQDYQDVYSLMVKYISRVFNYPMYHYWSKLNAAASIGDTKLYFNPAFTDLRDGEAIAFFDSLMTKTYFAVIDTVDVDGATLTEPLTIDVPEWYFVSPAPQFSVGKPTMNMGSVAGDFELNLEGAQTRDILRPDQVNSPTIIDGKLVLDIRPLSDDNVGNTFDQNIIWLDNDIANPTPRTSWYSPFISGSRSYLIHRESGMDVWRAIANNLRGRLNSFLLPTFRNDLPVVGTPALSATQFLTNNIQFFDYWRSKAWKYIRIQSDAGVIYRSINEVLANYDVTTGEPESLTIKIAGNIGAGAGSNSNMIVSFVNTCRLDSDEIVIDHGSIDSVLSIKVRMVEE